MARGLALLTCVARVALAGAAVLAVQPVTGALAQDDLAVEGEKVFKRCSACHMVGEGAQNRVGPELNLIIGRTAGSLPGYTFSDAMIAAGADGLVWTEETLGVYLESPKGLVPGTKMTFAGLKKAEDRAAVIAYLATAGGGT